MKIMRDCLHLHHPMEECLGDVEVTLADWEELLDDLLENLLTDEDFTSISKSLKEISKSLATIAHYLRVIP